MEVEVAGGAGVEVEVILDVVSAGVVLSASAGSHSVAPRGELVPFGHVEHVSGPVDPL